MASIELTTEEYKNLLILSNIGINIVEFAQNEELEASNVALIEKAQSLESLSSKLLSMADKFDASDAVMLDEDTKEYYPSDEIDQVAFGYIAEYDVVTFWDELTYKLAQRDALKELDVDKLTEEDMSDEVMQQHFKVLSKYEEKWAEALAEKGIDALS